MQKRGTGTDSTEKDFEAQAKAATQLTNTRGDSNNAQEILQATKDQKERFEQQICALQSSQATHLAETDRRIKETQLQMETS